MSRMRDKHFLVTSLFSSSFDVKWESNFACVDAWKELCPIYAAAHPQE